MTLARRIRQRIAHMVLTHAQIRYLEVCERLEADRARREKSEEVTSFRVRRKQALAATRGELV